MSFNLVWLHKLFHQHMKTKSALIPGFTVPPAVAPTIAPAPIPQRVTRATVQMLPVLLQVKRGLLMMMMDLQSLLLQLTLLLI
jgi:hypothetical protein